MFPMVYSVPMAYFVPMIPIVSLVFFREEMKELDSRGKAWR